MNIINKKKILYNEIRYKNKILAYFSTYNKNNLGVNFFTPGISTLQVGSLNHKKNHLITPHCHNKNLRKIYFTNEVLFIIKGKLRVDFYNEKKKYIFSKLMKKNDIIVLLKSIHGFKVLEDSHILEIKQGPYNSLKDKRILSSPSIKKLNFLK